MAAVVEPEVGRHAGQDDAVGLAQRLAALVPAQQRMRGAQETAGHAGEIDRQAELLDRPLQLGDRKSVQHRLRADEEERPVGARQGPGGAAHPPCARRRRRRQRRRLAALVGPVEAAVEVAREVPALQALAEGGLALTRLRRFRKHAVPLARRRLRIQEIHRTLEEDRARDALARRGKGRLEKRCELADPPRTPLPLDVRRHERLLVDVLQRAAPLEHGGGRAPQNDHRRLRHLGVLHRCDGVREARPGGDRGDARHAGEAGGRVGGEDGVDLVTRVDHPDPERLGAHQDRRNVAPAEREQRPHPLPLQHLRDAISAMAHGFEDSHSPPPTATRARPRATSVAPANELSSGASGAGAPTRGALGECPREEKDR